MTVAVHVDQRRDERRLIEALFLHTLIGVKQGLEEPLGEKHVLVDLVDPSRLAMELDRKVLHKGDVVDGGREIRPAASGGEVLEFVVDETARHDADVNVLGHVGGKPSKHVVPQRGLVAGQDDAELLAAAAPVDKVVGGGLDRPYRLVASEVPSRLKEGPAGSAAIQKPVERALQGHRDSSLQTRWSVPIAIVA